MRFFAFVMALAAMLSSCSKQENGKNTFTLANGVSLTEVKACSDVPQRGLSVTKSGADYLVTVAGAFSCDSEIKAPYLTLAKEKKATLVIGSTATKSGCECFRSVTVKLSGRLESGDAVYVLNNSEVLGHVVLP